MLQKWDLNPNERLVVRIRNQHRLRGPGRIRLFPWEKPLVTISTDVTGQVYDFCAVNTAKGIPVSIRLRVSYKVDLDLLADRLFRATELSAGNWLSFLKEQTETALRKLVSQYPWQGVINNPTIQNRIERHLARVVADDMAPSGIKITQCCIIEAQLPDDLREAQLQSAVLKNYEATFGPELPQAMSGIAQLKLLHTMQDQGRVQVFLTSSDFSNASSHDGAIYYLPPELTQPTEGR